MDTKSNKRPREEPVANKKRLISKTIIYDESKPNQWLDDPPLEIWDHVIIPMLGLKDLALARPVCTFFEAYWQDKFNNNVLPLRVGLDVATINDVMVVIEILSRRREYTKLNPFVVLLGKGEHEISSSYQDPFDDEDDDDGDTIYDTEETVRRLLTLSITCSSITFLGQGKEETIIIGGFAIDRRQNIMFKQMTLTNPSSGGMYINDAEVELNDVVVRNCGEYAINMNATNNSRLVARRCEFKECLGGLGCYQNSISHFHDCTFYAHKVFGLYVNRSTVHLHGESTAIHSNGANGIFALGYVAKVLIHLPSHHNTSYNNGVNGGRDRITQSGATITNVED